MQRHCRGMCPWPQAALGPDRPWRPPGEGVEPTLGERLRTLFDDVAHLSGVGAGSTRLLSEGRSPARNTSSARRQACGAAVWAVSITPMSDQMAREISETTASGRMRRCRWLSASNSRIRRRASSMRLAVLAAVHSRARQPRRAASSSPTRQRNASSPAPSGSCLAATPAAMMSQSCWRTSSSMSASLVGNRRYRVPMPTPGVAGDLLDAGFQASGGEHAARRHRGAARDVRRRRDGAVFARRRYVFGSGPHRHSVRRTDSSAGEKSSAVGDTAVALRPDGTRKAAPAAKAVVTASTVKP